MGFQSRVNSDRFSYLRSSLLYICLELIDIPCRVSFTLCLIQCFHCCRSIDTFDLGSTSWISVRGRLIKLSDQLDQILDKRDMDPQVVIVDQFVVAMASIQETITSLDQKRMWTSLELFGRVFTCLWTLGSISSTILGLVIFLKYL